MAQDNKTEQATPRRRQRAREKGQVARSRDLIGAASGMAATMLLASQLPCFPQAWRELFHAALDGAVSGKLRMDGFASLACLLWRVRGHRRCPRAELDRCRLFRARPRGPGLRSVFAAAGRRAHQPRRQVPPVVLHHRVARAGKIPAAGRRHRLPGRRLPAPRLESADAAALAHFPLRTWLRRGPPVRSCLEIGSGAVRLGHCRLPVRTPPLGKRFAHEPSGTGR